MSAHSVFERLSDASSLVDQDGRQQPLLEPVCDNGLVEDTHMVSLIQYVELGHVQVKYKLLCTLPLPHITTWIQAVDRVEVANSLFIKV